MFPYTMLASTLMFYSNNWPKRFIKYSAGSQYDDVLDKMNTSTHCIYEITEEVELPSHSESFYEKKIEIRKTTTKSTFYHKFFAIFAILYLTEQTILPYSHSVTKVKS